MSLNVILLSVCSSFFFAVPYNLRFASQIYIERWMLSMGKPMLNDWLNFFCSVYIYGQRSSHGHNKLIQEHDRSALRHNHAVNKTWPRQSFHIKWVRGQGHSDLSCVHDALTYQDASTYQHWCFRLMLFRRYAPIFICSNDPPRANKLVDRPRDRQGDSNIAPTTGDVGINKQEACTLLACFMKSFSQSCQRYLTTV